MDHIRGSRQFLPVLLVANDKRVMGDLVNGRLANGIGSATLLLSALVAVAALPLLGPDEGGAS